MGRILLVSTNTCDTPYAVYPLGMSQVAAALEGAGHAVRQFDWLVAGRDEAALLAAVAEFAPDCIALSIRNIDRTDSLIDRETGWELAEARRICRLLKERTDIPVLAGGAAVSMLPESIRTYIGADHVLCGEGELSAPGTIANLLSGSTPSDVVLPPPGDRVCGGAFHGPLYDPDLVRHYWDTSEIMGVQTKRGCPFQCSYCSYPTLEGSACRTRPAEDVVEDMKRLLRDHGVNSFFFVDSVFNDPNGRYLEVVEALLRAELGVRWSAFFTPRGLDAEAVALCKRSGLYAVELGTDAGCDTTLAALRKPFSWADVAHANEMLVSARIPCCHYIVFGAPEETEATVEEALANVERLESCVAFGFSGLRILPGTALRQRAIEDGVVTAQDDLFESVYYVSSTIDKDWMDRRVEEAWSGRNDRIFPPEDGTRTVALLHSLGWKGLLWDTMVKFQ
ncbi:MAG: cobalamin-dependent protein [Lentisphaeria bacterium]|nr:cobalamin-dependent protein [Lentisphaeria bacterium]